MTVSDAARPWRVVAVDDEPPALKRIAALLAATSGLELVGTFTDPVAAVAALPELAPHVLLLDVQMPGMTGFEVLHAIATSDGPTPVVVFATAYDEHALRAFEVGAVDYLLKPVERERFRTTMDRVKARLDGMSAGELRAHLAAVRRLLAPAGDATPATTRVSVKVKDRIVLLDPAQIDRVDAEGNVIHVQVGRERLSFRETLTSFAERLPASAFVRVNRSTLVNVARVRYAEPWFNGDYVLVLVDGSKVTSGRTYREGVRALLGMR